MKELIKKEKLSDFFRNHGIFILFSIVLLWISLLLIQVADAYMMLNPNNTIETTMLHNLFQGEFGTVATWITIIPIVLYVIVFSIFSKKEIDISKVFLIIIIPLGIIHMFLNPLGRVPDEDTHIRRAYEISQGRFITQVNKEGDVGNELPAGLNLITKENQTYNIFDKNKEKDYGDEKEFFGFNNTAIYSFICYVPQAFGIWITRLFGASIMVQAYGARAVNLIVYTVLIYFAIKKIPFKKLAVFMIAFLPIAIQEAASISPDALTNGICIFFVANILHLMYREEKLSKKDYVVLGITSVLVALVKIIYLPLCALVYLIPNDKFDTKKKKWIILSIIFVLSVLLNLGWLKYANSHYLQAYNGANPKEQISFVLQDPYRYITTCFRDVHLRIDYYVQGLLGNDLSHIDIDMSRIMQLPLFLIIIFAFVCDENGNIKPDWKVKLLLAGVAVAVIALLFTSEYIAWNPVGNFWVDGVQPRYYIPILLLLAVICHMNSLKLEKKLDYKYIYMFTVVINLHAIVSMMNVYMK